MVENVLFVSIDSLRRDHLSAYAEEPATLDRPVRTPNLDRFAERSVVFDTHYAGSLPCMPARREWLTGIQEFLWRPWGPTEPFDVTIPQACRQAGILTQLVTDHYHYFRHGSHGYYEDFNGFEFVRGHEADRWKTAPTEPAPRTLAQLGVDETKDVTDVGYAPRTAYARNVHRFDELDERDFFAPKVFSTAASWLRENREWDRWFCYVDSFDVHEPFHCPEPYASMYTDEDPTDPELLTWPFYGRVDEGQSAISQRELDFLRAQFAGKTTMVDRWFGRILDRLDREGLWEETMVVVTSDHGHYLGDHGWIGKPAAPVYDVLARTPLLIHHPDAEPVHRDAVTSAVDIYATVLSELDVQIPEPTHSRTLSPLIRNAGAAHREWALYGYWGSSVNVTDGRYTYFHPTDPTIDAACFSTEMMNPRGRFHPRSPKSDAEPARVPYADAPVWRFTTSSHDRQDEPMLFDTEQDPRQSRNLAGTGSDVEDRLRRTLERAMSDLQAPSNLFRRLELERAN